MSMDNQDARQFRGVWIPADIWLSKELSLQEKVMLVEIESLQHPERGCFKTNKRLAEFFNLSASRVSEVISSLARKGFIRIVNIRDGKQIVERRIFLSTPFDKPDTPSESRSTPSEKAESPLRYSEAPPSEKAEERGSSLSNTQERVSGEVIAAGAVAPVAAQAESPRVEIPADMPGPKDQSCKTFKAWANYAFAYRKRYHVWPKWNAKAAGQISQLVDRLGADVAHHVAAFYVGVNDARLVNDCHTLNNLLAKCEAYHTQWATGRQMNATTARQIEATQANVNAALEAADRILARQHGGSGNANPFLC